MELLMEKLDDFGDKYQVYGRIVGIKSLLNAASITAVLIDINAAQSKLVLLENFNENYSKCLRLLLRYNINTSYRSQVQGQKVFTSNDWCSETWVRETCLATLLQLLNKVWFSGSDGSVGVALGLVFSGFSGFSSH
ncbi:hypothetical protein Tco_1176616 [Tanacetum coccineum]